LENSEVTLLEGMAKMEGFGVPGARPTKNNNPGDLEYGSFAKSHGATGTDGRFAIFPDVVTGYAAMRALLQVKYGGMTLENALNIYAPPVENQTNLYLKDVCSFVGCQPTDLIDNLL
jgi:hypothetical protein